MIGTVPDLLSDYLPEGKSSGQECLHDCAAQLLIFVASNV